VALVVGGTPAGMHVGIAVGILSALLVAIFGSLNKRYVERGDPLVMTGVELAAGALFLTLLALAVPRPEFALRLPDLRDAALLVVLAIGCTLVPFALSLVALRHLSAFSAQLAVSLEPVYAILLAIALLGEQHELDARFYVGVAIILASVLAHALLRGRPRSGTAATRPIKG
jgi:drug/metabolite transporter (DMT)-like permease